MKCPNPKCGATDHEPGAKFCHRCGAPLITDNTVFCNGKEPPKPQPHSNHSSAPADVMAIDLGLPSGTKWANMNVGATSPEGYGGYYAWGETEEKDVYDWNTYKPRDGSGKTCNDLGQDIAGTRYDVAYVKWGCKWQMPTKEQMKELLENCNNEWTEHNQVAGRRFTSKINGNSIFLPASGGRWYDSLAGAGNNGYYWSSTQDPLHWYGAYGPCFNSGGTSWNHSGDHRFGFTVRPVTR